MKSLVMTMLTAIMAVSVPHILKGQPAQPVQESMIEPDSMNLAILVIDFLTYKFEKASISRHPFCEECDRDSLPFRIQYRQPSDFGDIRFYYTGNDSLLFGATIIWNGTGEIYHPREFRKAEEFPPGSRSIGKPVDSPYFDVTLTPDIYSPEEYRARADSAWDSIDSLQLVQDFASGPFRAGFYAWPPSVGVFCPSCAKWIIFLYRGNPGGQQAGSEQIGLNARLFPVPAQDELFVEFGSLPEKPYSIAVFDPKGMRVLHLEGLKDRRIRIGLSGLPDGLYQLRIHGAGWQTGSKFMIIR